MKVGILTFHNAQNFGAVLQCYALQRYITDIGHDVVILDYKNEQILSSYKLFRSKCLLVKNPIRLLHRFVSELLLIRFRIKKEKAFRQFLLNYLVIEGFSKSTLEDIDMVIVGSDQVWNVHLTGGFHNPYWGEFPFKYDGVLISYAASVGRMWNADNDGLAKKYLSVFSSISVREESTAKKIAVLTQKEIHVVADPTILLSDLQWESILVKPKKNDKYVLLYEVRRSQKAIRIAQDLAERYGIKLIVIKASIDELEDIGYNSVSPQDFIGYIKYAECVVCTSFHGTLFSIIFKRPFYSIRKNDGQNERVENLLSVVNLKERMIDTTPVLDLSIDWESVHQSLNEYKLASEKFLYENLNM